MALNPFFIYVDDDPEAALLVRIALRHLGVEDAFIHCADGEELIGWIENASSARGLPAFILLDLRMPRMDGFESLRWLRAKPLYVRLPVVVMSSSELSADLELAMTLGATDYMVKAGKFKDLRASLQLLLRRFGILPA